LLSSSVVADDVDDLLSVCQGSVELLVWHSTAADHRCGERYCVCHHLTSVVNQGLDHLRIAWWVHLLLKDCLMKSLIRFLSTKSAKAMSVSMSVASSSPASLGSQGQTL